MNNEQLASEINRLAAHIEAGDKVASRFRLFKRLFDSVFRQVDATLNAVKKRDDLPDQNFHKENLERIYNELEECWADLGKSLQVEEDSLFLN